MIVLRTGDSNFSSLLPSMKPDSQSITTIAGADVLANSLSVLFFYLAGTCCPCFMPGAV